MSKYIKPTSDAARRTLLQTALETGRQDREVGRAYMSNNTLNRLEEFVPKLDAANAAVVQAVADRRAAMVVADNALLVLKAEVRTVRSTLRRQVRSQQISPGCLPFYEVPLTGAIPYPHKRGDWLALAERLLKGDDQAQNAGFTSVLNRSQLARAFQTMQQAVADLTNTDATLQAVREARARLRTQTITLCDDLVNELRYHLRKKPATLRRQIMRTYGVHFRPELGEVVYSGEAAALF